MIDENAQGPAADDLCEQHLDIGLALREPLLDIWLKCSHQLFSPNHKKSGRAPTSGTTTGVKAPARKLCREDSIGGPSRSRCITPCPIAVKPVVLTLRREGAGQCQRLARLVVPAEQLPGATQAEECIVVGWSCRGDRFELLGGALVALGMEQRAAESLADRGLAGLEVARAVSGTIAAW